MNYKRNLSESQNQLDVTEQYVGISRQRSCPDVARARATGVAGKEGPTNSRDSDEETIVDCEALPRVGVRERKHCGSGEHGLKVVPVDTCDLHAFAHKLRTALNGLLGASQVIQRSQLTAEQQLYFDVMSWSVDSLAELVLLNPASVLNDTSQSSMAGGETVIMLDDFTADLRSFAEHIAREKKVELSWHQADLAFVASPRCVREVMSSLVFNALTHTPRRGTVYVDIAQDSTLVGEQVVVRVIDTGPGITSKKIEEIFARPANNSAAELPKFSATCRPLSVCGEAIARVGGSLEIESPSSGGAMAVARFDARLTRFATDCAAADFHGRLVQFEVADLEILVADDSSTNRHVMQAFLDANDATADYASDGREALNALEVKNFDLFLLDIDMPGVSGEVVAEHIRRCESEQGLARKPIYAVTARCSPDDWLRYQQIGFDGMVPKPVSREMLGRVLRMACRKNLNLGDFKTASRK